MVNQSLTGHQSVELVERFGGALRDHLANVLRRESYLVQSHFCLCALIKEFHDDTRDRAAEISVVRDFFGLDDLVVLTFIRKLTGTGNLHYEGERTAYAEIHGAIDLGGVFAAPPLLQTLRIFPERKNERSRGVKQAGDLQAIVADLHFGLRNDFSLLTVTTCRHTLHGTAQGFKFNGSFPFLERSQAGCRDRQIAIPKTQRTAQSIFERSSCPPNSHE